MGAVLTLLPACQHRPPAELEAARSALDAAWAACAAEYAGSPFDEARAQLEEVARLVDAGKRGAARRACEETVRLAEIAERDARQQLAVARSAAELAIREAEEALAKARAAGRGTGSGVDVETAAQRLQEAELVATSSHCNYRKAQELALEAKSLASNADTRTVAGLRR